MRNGGLWSKLRAFSITVFITAFSVLVATSAFAQISGKAFEGFGGNSKDPIQIEANELEVLDGRNRAIFRGDVKVRQGSSQISTGKMIVFYLAKSGSQQGDIERLEFSGGVVVTSGTNIVSGDRGKYWVKPEDILLEGNVVVSQGDNVAKGCKLTANLKTNIAKLDNCGGRLKMILTPGSTKKP